MKGVSIIICCYNSAQRLPTTLKHIAAQQIPEDCPWEIILVDNASTDDTAPIAMQEWAKYTLDASFIIAEENKPGLIYARNKGIEIASYDYLLFCDDDNWLSESYVRLVYEIMSNDPEIGVLGGYGIAITETVPEPWINLGAYATGKQAECSGDVTHTKTTVYGAGSVYRKQALNYLHNHGFKAYLSGRKGSVLFSGEDAELCWAISLAGYKIWYDERLGFKHYIPSSRLTFDYLKKLEYGNGYSSALHIPYYEVISNSQRPSIKNTWWWRYFALRYASIKRAMVHNKSNSPTDILIKLRSKGCIDGLWGLRKEYSNLQRSLKNATWIKNR